MIKNKTKQNSKAGFFPGTLYALCYTKCFLNCLFGIIFSQNQIFPILLYRKRNFLIFVRAHVIMTSQKPNAGHVGTLFGIKV